MHAAQIYAEMLGLVDQVGLAIVVIKRLVPGAYLTHCRPIYSMQTSHVLVILCTILE